MVKGKISAQNEEHFRIGIFQDNLEKHLALSQSLEISLITEGTGKRIVADSMESIRGDLVFIGQNLPCTSGLLIKPVLP